MDDEDESERKNYGRDRGELWGEEEQGEDEPLPPPPPDQDKELLFLIEFLVDTLTVIPENMKVENIDPCALQGPASINLTFLHFPSMYMNEKEVNPDRVTGCNEIQFNAGKSLMFALTEAQFEEPPPIFLVVEAWKEMPHAFRIPRVVIGKTKIQLSELFKQVFDKYDENPKKTVSKSIKDKYQLIGEKHLPAGDVTIYIRLTCIGENIVTEFEKDTELNDTVLFKNKESKKIYECKESEKSEGSWGLTLPGWGDGKRKEPCEERAPTPPYDPDDENFEEIYAQINDSVMVIKVEKGKRKPKPKEFHISEFCDCDIPLPQNLVAGMSDLSLSPASQKSFNIDSCEPMVPTDKRVGLNAANQLFFEVPPIEMLSSPDQQNITYNVKSCLEGEKHGHKGKNSYKVITDNNPEGPPPKLPNDPEKDVFVLKIMKKGKKEKGTDALNLEFKIPKEKIVPPPWPPYMIAKGSGPEKAKKGKKKK